MAKISRTLATPSAGQDTLHPRENLFVSGNLGALNAEIIIPVDGCASFGLDLRGTFSLTVELSGSVDGTNWTLIPVRGLNIASVGYVSAVAGTAAGIWVGKCAPFRLVRARVTAYTSGTAVATLNGDLAPLDDTLQGSITPVLATAVGASGAAVTLTIAAPGAGLRHYLTYLRVSRYASALLTAAGTPITITTTNIPGSLAFTVETEAAAQGVRTTVVDENFAYPVATSAQNTATTIVCPLTTNVIWRVTAGYYIAP